MNLSEMLKGRSSDSRISMEKRGSLSQYEVTESGGSALPALHDPLYALTEHFLVI